MKMKEKYNLDSPENFFQLNFFKNNTEVFYEYLRSASLSEFKPTKSHYFIKLLQNKNILNLVYTQNIDGLEEKSGVVKNKIVYAHGNVNEAICSSCRKQHSVESLRSHINSGKIMYCDICSSPCKFSVVLFGEPLPDNYFNKKDELIIKTDLVFVIGTSLVVKPFAHLVNLFPAEIPKVIINRENLLEKSSISKFVNFPESFVSLVGEADEVVEKIVSEVGWRGDFTNLLL